MLYPLSRKAIFQASSLADTFVAYMQQGYAQDLDMNEPQERSLLKKYYDHLQPFQPLDPPLDNDMMVLAFPASNQQDFFGQMPVAMAQLFKALGTKELYIVDFLKTSLNEFPFETYGKRNKLKQLLGWNLHYGGFQLSADDLSVVLPLFYFSGIYARPVIALVADGEVPLVLRLCKDGNFHCNYQQLRKDRITTAASAAGFLTGDVYICWEYSVQSLPLKAPQEF